MKHTKICITGILSLFVVHFSLLVSCIAPAPKVDGQGKIETDVNGNTAYSHEFPGAAKDAINRAIESKGFKKYKSNQGEKSAVNWQWLALITASCAIVATLLWYFLKIKEFGGGAIILLLSSFGCTMMAELVTNTIAKICFAIVVIIAIAIGLLMRDKSFIAWIKGRKAKAVGNG